MTASTDGKQDGTAPAGTGAAAIELRRINKRFGPVRANRDIDLIVRAGTIHGIIGENGAGKSTLMSILYGFYRADDGTILVNGRERQINTPDDAIAAGIGMVHQHFMLVDTFTVLENVILGMEGGFRLRDGLATARQALEKLEREYSLHVDLDAVVGDLPVGIQQRVEILKALHRGADTLILDEPTAVLTPQEADHLFRILRALRDQGKTVILITHKLREIMAITDAVSVMRNGEMVAHRQTAGTDREELAELMVGRKVLVRVSKDTAQAGETAMSVRDLDVVDALGVRRVKKASFEVRRGEIVGIAGVAGNGQSELLAALAGIRAPAAGSITIGGRSSTADAPLDAHVMRQLGVAHVPEDRLREGLVKTFHAYENTILGYHGLPEYNSGPIQRRGAVIADCENKMRRYDVRPPNPQLLGRSFSGGNQQKIVIAREFDRDPDLLLVGQPTRGVDIGAIEFIHRRLIEMRDAGKAVLLVSVELDEIFALADRILVMFDGNIVGEVAADQANEKRLGLMMAGIAPEEAETEAPTAPADERPADFNPALDESRISKA
ncbi:ABC transporter ATP-binding protein [Fodinicurvata sp. EGI_FJ10296]|uniref:ABC transporter ATP-binding protein n=1 Tax=Fodinicurvata sp. EGI_FJ10296 TaxID=3231908 RepID=UPI003455F05B